MSNRFLSTSERSIMSNIPGAPPALPESTTRAVAADTAPRLPQHRDAPALSRSDGDLPLTISFPSAPPSTTDSMILQSPSGSGRRGSGLRSLSTSSIILSPPGRRGSLTFSNSVKSLKRAGTSMSPASTRRIPTEGLEGLNICLT